MTALRMEPPAAGAFLGLPTVTDLGTVDAEAAVLGIPHGVPYDMGSAVSHAAGAPAAVRSRSARFGAFLGHHDFDVDGPLLGEPPLRVVDCGDVPGDPRDIPGNSQRATDAVRWLVERGPIPVVLGGDDSVTIMILRAFEDRGPLHVVQVDAHLDFRDDVRGVRDGYSSAMRRASEMPWVRQIVHVGLRGVGASRPDDVAASVAAGNVVVKAAEMHRDGVEAALRHLPVGAACFVTIDLDGLDPAVAPGVLAPMPAGLRFEQLAELLHALARRCALAGVDVVEYVPARDVNGLTSLVVVRLLANVLGALAGTRTAAATTGERGGGG